MFAQARETSASIEAYNGCKADVFIDDVITIGVDIGDYLKQVIAGQHTLIHALAHRNSSEDFITCQNFVA